RDDDKLRAVGVLTQQRHEAADVGVVERGLDLVEQVERARARKEEREEERDRSERLLAARQQRQPLHLLADRAQMDLDARLRLLVLRLDQLQPSFPAGEERRCDLGEVLLNRVERLRKAALDGFLELCAQLLELGEALLEVLALCRQLLEPRLLRVVLLLRERIHLPERLAAALEALRALGELVAVVALGALVGARMLEPAARLVGLRLDACDLDVD